MSNGFYIRASLGTLLGLGALLCAVKLLSYTGLALMGVGGIALGGTLLLGYSLLPLIQGGELTVTGGEVGMIAGGALLWGLAGLLSCIMGALIPAMAITAAVAALVLLMTLANMQYAHGAELPRLARRAAGVGAAATVAAAALAPGSLATGPGAPAPRTRDLAVAAAGVAPGAADGLARARGDRTERATGSRQGTNAPIASEPAATPDEPGAAAPVAGAPAPGAHETSPSLGIVGALRSEMSK